MFSWSSAESFTPTQNGTLHKIALRCLSYSFEIPQRGGTRPLSFERPSKTELQIEKFRCRNSNLNLVTIKKRFLPFFVSTRSVTYPKSYPSTVLESLGHVGHDGVLIVPQRNTHGERVRNVISGSHIRESKSRLSGSRGR